MLIHELRPSGGLQKDGKRLGRGGGSGKGNYCGKGCKGQKARSGGGVPTWFEGGQTPLFMRLPKLRGFKRHKALDKPQKSLSLALIQRDNRFEETVSKELLLSYGYIRSLQTIVKFIDAAQFSKKLTFVAIEQFSQGARTRIEQSGGTIVA